MIKAAFFKAHQETAIFDPQNVRLPRVIWDSVCNPVNLNFDRILYKLRLSDHGCGLLLDPLTIDGVHEDYCAQIIELDALVSPYNRLERKMQIMQRTLDRVNKDLKPVAMQISKPFLSRGTAQVVVIWELSDGQTISVFFHNPDTTPKKIKPTDDLISWKWLLNKKDVTILVAPERGSDLNVRTVATRLIKLAAKNSASFAKANQKRAEKLAAVNALKQEVLRKEELLNQLNKELELLKFELQEFEIEAQKAPQNKEENLPNLKISAEEEAASQEFEIEAQEPEEPEEPSQELAENANQSQEPQANELQLTSEQQEACDFLTREISNRKRREFKDTHLPFAAAKTAKERQANAQIMQEFEKINAKQTKKAVNNWVKIIENKDINAILMFLDNARTWEWNAFNCFFLKYTGRDLGTDNKTMFLELGKWCECPALYNLFRFKDVSKDFNSLDTETLTNLFTKTIRECEAKNAITPDLKEDVERGFDILSSIIAKNQSQDEAEAEQPLKLELMKLKLKEKPEKVGELIAKFANLKGQERSEELAKLARQHEQERAAFEKDLRSMNSEERQGIRGLIANELNYARIPEKLKKEYKKAAELRWGAVYLHHKEQERIDAERHAEWRKEEEEAKKEYKQTIGLDEGLDVCLKNNNNDILKAAKAYYIEHLQGKFVNTQIGKVWLMGGKNRSKLFFDTETKELKAHIFPHIPFILRAGEYKGAKPLNKVRKDNFVNFHYFEKTIELTKLNKKVTAIIDVGETEDKKLVYQAYHLHYKNPQSLDNVDNKKDSLLRNTAEHWLPLMSATTADDLRGISDEYTPILDNVNTIFDKAENEKTTINIRIVKVVDLTTGERLYDLEDQTDEQKEEQAAKEKTAQAAANQSQKQEGLTKADQSSGIVLQNRDRSSAASIAQMTAIAANPDYLSLGQSRSMSTGAPVVFGDMPNSAIIGKTEKINDGKRRRFVATYAVIEAAKIRPSNNADGTSIKEYARSEDGILRVIAGNGRAAGIIAAYHKGTAANYKAEMLEDLSDNLGFNAANVKKIEQMAAPILVRHINEQDMPSDIADASNISQAANLSPLEQAINDGARLDITAFEFDENGEPTFETVKIFTNAMPASERANLLNPDGSPTRQARERILAATFNKAYANEELVRIFSQAQDLETANIIKTLASVAGNMAKLDEGGGAVLRQAIANAAVCAINARRQGFSLKEYVAQGDIFRDQNSHEILKFFAKNNKSGKKMKDTLKEITNKALENLERVKIEKHQKTMFGKTKLFSIDDLITLFNV